MWEGHLELVDEELMNVLAHVSRQYERVYPHHVQPHLPYYRSEKTLRQDFRRLQEKGVLRRIGQRRGWQFRYWVARLKYGARFWFHGSL